MLAIANALGRNPQAERWRTEARCRGADPAIFMPARGQAHDDALAFCSCCPVKLPCLEYAMRSTAGLTGVWGGSSARDRRRARIRGWDARRLLAYLDGHG
jgi:WhiB family redox-sensing transcriptional regulator